MIPLEWSHAVTDISASGRRFQREATEAERQLVAKQLGLIACVRLAADYVIRPLGKGRYRLAGPCTAEVTQACVVTLAPITSMLTLPLDIDFDPEPDLGPLKADDEVEVLSLPEVAEIENGQLPVGRVVFETLAAGLDPFPRVEDAAFTWHDPQQGQPQASPFAVLHTLKPRDKPTEPDKSGD